MTITETPIPDLLIIQPVVFEDDRGYFFESYNAKKVGNAQFNWVQDNESLSKKGVLRGLHYQIGEYCQAKLVRVIQGEVFDVAVDMRPNSPTYRHWYGETLSSQNKKQMLIPRGFAHGFLVISEEAIFAYKCDNYYHAESDAGIHFCDPTLDIRWPMSTKEIVVSTKDAKLPLFGEHHPIW